MSRTGPSLPLASLGRRVAVGAENSPPCGSPVRSHTPSLCSLQRCHQWGLIPYGVDTQVEAVGLGLAWVPGVAKEVSIVLALLAVGWHPAWNVQLFWAAFCLRRRDVLPAYSSAQLTADGKVSAASCPKPPLPGCSCVLEPWSSCSRSTTDPVSLRVSRLPRWGFQTERREQSHGQSEARACGQFFLSSAEGQHWPPLSLDSPLGAQMWFLFPGGHFSLDVESLAE